MRRFEFAEGKSSKFWEIGLQGNLVTTRFGRIGAEGQTQTKSFPTDAEAQDNHDKLIAEKLRKGYLEVASKADLPTEETQEALFWKLIADSKRGTEGDVEAQMERLEELLSKLNDDELVTFADLCDEKIARCYRSDLWAAAYYDNDGCSDDSFMDWRAGLVWAGRKAYESVFAQPDNLANFQVEFVEQLPSIPREIWEQRHGSVAMPSNFNIDEQPDIEDELFDEDDDEWFRKTFPKLTKKKGEDGDRLNFAPSRQSKYTVVTIRIACKYGTPEFERGKAIIKALRSRVPSVNMIFDPDIIDELVVKIRTDNHAWFVQTLPKVLDSVEGDHSNVSVLYEEGS